MILDVGGDHDRTDLAQSPHAVFFAPHEKLRDGLCVRRSGISIPDRRRKELNETPRGGVTRAREGGRQAFHAGPREIPRWNRDEPGHGRGAS